MVFEDVPNDSESDFVHGHAPEESFTFANYEITTPMIAVVDTCFLRTGLQVHLTRGDVPPSLLAMRSGSIRAFMEGDTLREMFARIPKFAIQMATSERALRDLFVSEWLPYIRIVELPTYLRELDQRSLEVQQEDEDDYAAASLAALLSPCILMTHDKDFKPLGVQHYEQAILAIFLVDDVIEGDAQLRTAIMIPTMPFFALGVGTKHAYDRFGPIALGVVGLFLAGGVFVYLKQPKERRDAIRSSAGKYARGVLELYGEAASEAQRARQELSQTLVPPSSDPHPFVLVLRVLATTSTSLSAQQLHTLLQSQYSFNVSELRSYLHAYKSTLFFEERRGGFLLGLPYEVWRNGTASSFMID